MFGLFGGKKIEVFSPVAGKVIDISAVADEVFSAKMLGDGFAVEPEEDIIYAPCDGKIALVAATGHAVAVETNGVEILIHIGIDTVELGGEGFSAFIQEGDVVRKGDKLIAFDREIVKSHGKALTTMVVLTNMEDKVKKLGKDLEANQGSVLQAELK